MKFFCSALCLFEISREVQRNERKKHILNVCAVPLALLCVDFTVEHAIKYIFGSSTKEAECQRPTKFKVMNIWRVKFILFLQAFASSTYSVCVAIKTKRGDIFEKTTLFTPSIFLVSHRL